MALTDRRHAQTAQGGTTAATPAPSPRRVPQVGAGAVLALQRSAGNTAVVQHLRPSVVAQRARIDLPAGGSVGDASASNGREAVLLVLKRLYGLWAIETKDFDQTFPAVEAMPSGTMVTEKPVLDIIDKAVVRLEEPTLAAQVALAQFSLPIGAGVGRGQPNRPADVADLQDLLHVRWHLSDDDYGREHGAATSGAPLSESSLSATFAGITKLKREAAAGTGKPGWSPLIRSDEAGGSGPGGQDRFADRTFSFGEFMIFVPSAATKGLSNFVYVCFSTAGVLDASAHVEHHGLRAAAETGGWILFGVQGEPGKAFTISEAQVRAGLESIGRPGQIAAVRLSAHSRGNGSMARTLKEVLFTPSLIDHVTVLDGSDFAKSLKVGFQNSKVPASRITADFVTTGAFPKQGVTSHGIDALGIRALGYARLINDAVATGRVGTLPAGIDSKVKALPLPPRGSFSAADPLPAGKTGLNAFMRSNAAALAALRTGEGQVANVGQLSRLVNSSPYAFVEWNNLLNINDERAPRSQWRSVSPGIYSHHLFVAEVAGEVFG